MSLHRSATDPSRPLTWDLPGGQLEEGEDLEASIKREIKEETGIKSVNLSIFDAVGQYNKMGQYWVQIGYIARVDMPEVKLSFEHHEYAWLSKEEFLRLESSDKIRRFISKL